MSRIAPGAADTVVVKPSNNIYTVLAGIALVVVILGLIAVWMAADSHFGGLLSAPQGVR